MLSGMPELDIQDWAENTEYNGYSTEDNIVKVPISQNIFI